MDSTLEHDMDKMSIHDNVEANQLSTNRYAPLAPIQDMDITDIQQLSIFNMDPQNIDVAHINHSSF